MSRLPNGSHNPSRSCGAMAAVLLLFSSFFTPLTHARYVLEKGKDVEVCVAYERALNGAREVTSPYSRPMDPNAKHFSKPKWEPLIIGEYPYLEKVWRYRFDRDVNPINFYAVDSWPRWRGTKEQYAHAWKSFLVTHEERGHQLQYVARIDIDNDGSQDTVYLSESATSKLFVVLSKDETDLDYEKTEFAQGHPSRKMQGLGEFRNFEIGERNYLNKLFNKTPVEDVTYATYDFFIYKGMAYYDLWWSRHPSYRGRPAWEAGRLQVFILEKGKHARNICTYRVQRDNTK